MSSISYLPIGIVESSFREPRRPEEMRAVPSRLVLATRFAAEMAALEVGQHLWVVYHLHLIEPISDHHPVNLFTKRIANRPNPIGFTLVRIVAVEGTTLTVVGLDAVDGTPILDLKPYQRIWDEPPVHRPSARRLNAP